MFARCNMGATCHQHKLQAELRRRDEVYRNRESQLQMQIASLSLSRGGGGKGRGSWEAESELVSRLLGEVESKDARIAALGDELDLMQHRLTRVLAARDSEWESEDGETEPQRLRHLEGQLAEKDGIIRALLATKAGRPSASSRILDQTKQRLDSARRRIFDSHSVTSSKASRYQPEVYAGDMLPPYCIWQTQEIRLLMLLM